MAYGGGGDAGSWDVPEHVPEDLITDFNYFDPPGAKIDPHGAWKEFQKGRRLAFTGRNGGHWILLRPDDIFDAMQDTATFSSNPFNIPRRPAGSPLTIPLEIDPPENARYRSIAIPNLSPKAIARIQPEVRERIRAVIAELKPKGGCEFITEVAVRVPVELFLNFVHLPAELLPKVRGWIENVSRNPDPAAQHAAHVATHEFVKEVLSERRRNPVPDELFTRLVQAADDGKMTFDEAASMGLNILFGGIDTVTSSLGFVAKHLAETPALRHELAAHPELGMEAVEEFTRRFGILSLGRTLTRDTTFAGVEMKKDDRVLLPIFLYGIDEEKFDRPLEIDLHREHSRHINFGAGPHRCIGSNLARPELRIFLEEWLKEIPDFSIAPGEVPTGSGGSALNILRLPLVW